MICNVFSRNKRGIFTLYNDMDPRGSNNNVRNQSDEKYLLFDFKDFDMCGDASVRFGRGGFPY